MLISIHAPPRGATTCIVPGNFIFGISIHAPPRGATRFLRQQEARQPQFQFTPLREGRPVAKLRKTAVLVFQFTPLREGRPGRRLS